MEQQTQLTKKERKALRRKEQLEQQQKQSKEKRTKQIVLWVLGIIIVCGSVFALAMAMGTSDSNNTAKITASITADDWTHGSSTAPVTLIEYSDFQCPACASYYSVVKQLISEFEENIYFSYRHFPLRQIHRNADLAARATEAAGIQGKFWEMHDMLFENQKTWSSENKAKDTFIEYAETLELDIEQFKTDIDSKETKEKVDNDYKSGISLGVNSTPSFFLNGEKIQNPRNYEALKSLVQEIISK